MPERDDEMMKAFWAAAVREDGYGAPYIHDYHGDGTSVMIDCSGGCEINLIAGLRAVQNLAATPTENP